MLTGIDVASYQPEAFPTEGLDFVVIKVTEGTNYTNPKWQAQRDRARKAGLAVGYGTRAANVGTWLPEVAPQAGDIKIESQAQDRFYNTGLDQTLKAKGITTLILTGWKISGSVTYTSVGATLRGYTVVVPVDATSDATDYEIFIGKYQILNQNSANAANEPLKPRT